MCTILIGLQAHSSAPLIVAANRDEYYARAASPPEIRSQDPWILAPRDLEAGGTWLGMTSWGIVGLTNQATRAALPKDLRSRGLLVMDMLRAPSFSDASSALRAHLRSHRYAPFSLLLASPNAGHVFYHTDVGFEWTDSTPLTPGWHVLPNAKIDDPNVAKVPRALEALRAIEDTGEEKQLLHHLRKILADHQEAQETPEQPSRFPPSLRRRLSALCVHTPLYGTRSYSILMMDAHERRVFYHGEGPPCQKTPRLIHP